MTRWASMLLCLTLALTSPARAAAPELNEDLRQAALKGDLEGVKGLLAKGAEVDGASEFGATALIFACDRGHLEVVKLLLERGADVNRKDATYQSTPISWAAYGGRADVVALLLAHGASGAGETLGAAVDRDKMDVLKAVLASGKATKEELSGALSSAKQSGKQEAVDLLTKAGATPMPSAASMVPAETLATYIGKYRNEGGFEIAVSLEEGRLMVTVPGQPPLELSPMEGGLFQLVGAGPRTISFNVEGGSVTGFTLRPPEAGAIFKKVPKAPGPSEPAPASPPKKEGTR